jgi:two-component system response regulator AtoC
VNGKTILVGEDEPDIRSYLEMALRCRGYSVESAEDGEEVLQYLREGNSVSAVLLDIMMPRKDGLDTLREIRSVYPQLPVVIVSGASSTSNVVEAMKIGATDFLGKPLHDDDLWAVLENALEIEAERSPAFSDGDRPDRFVSVSSSMRAIQSIIPQVARSEVPVLIQAETGSGKEVLARQIHTLSRRSQKVFLKLNCAALPSELVESELFGYERGAFTGAFQRKPGMFELADGGTLMLDEIGDMDVKLQAKLLQVLQDREFHRLGGKETVKVNVRVLAATHRDLEKDIEGGRFRADLYYRLNVINLYIPSLRDRTEDIVPLAEFLLRKHATSEIPLPAITNSLRQAMLAYQWPGNIRELENLIRRLAVLGDPELIAIELRSRAARTRIPEIPTGAHSQTDTPVLAQVTLAKEQAEREAILSALRSTRWNRKQAAAILKIDYKALLYKMKKLGVDEGPAE